MQTRAIRFCTIVLVLALIVFVSLDFSDAARGRGGGGSKGGGGSRGGSRSSSSSRSRSSSKSSGKSGSSYKSKITKNTPIKATSVRSPVIVRQTKVGSRSNTFTKAFVGYLVLRHAFSSAPVYRQGYPMYRSYVTIPKKRAVRVVYEEEKMLDADGELCVGQSSEKRTLREGIDENLVELNTTVKYKGSGDTQTYHGLNTSISLKDIKEQEFEVTSRARYNTTIIEGTNCTQIEKNVRGTMIAMYETNPDAGSPIYVNKKLFGATITLLIVFHVFQYY